MTDLHTTLKELARLVTAGERGHAERLLSEAGFGYASVKFVMDSIMPATTPKEAVRTAITTLVDLVAANRIQDTVAFVCEQTGRNQEEAEHITRIFGMGEPVCEVILRVLRQLVDCAEQNTRIGAIKLVRDETQSTLTEAKEIIHALIPPTYPTTKPEEASFLVFTNVPAYPKTFAAVSEMMTEEGASAVADRLCQKPGGGRGKIMVVKVVRQSVTTVCMKPV